MNIFYILLHIMCMEYNVVYHKVFKKVLPFYVLDCGQVKKTIQDDQDCFAL